ncbi:hypothetical protein LZ017_18555 [Pelomonas sp. CA6]|uniref:hypothetical protein n=1 Tax=Pelomonas sp. CA6 TaxID=2907999 RepID=UPI001F4C2CA3|nr:hypothetical protein [Pelomonas sp. CA6]MCH7345383.1 hypothetical protein [Pelomonas sp. CA6]
MPDLAAVIVSVLHVAAKHGNWRFMQNFLSALISVLKITHFMEKSKMNLCRISRLLAVFIFVLGANAAVAMIDTPPLRITKYLVYTDYGNGDFVVYSDTVVPGCDAFWLSATDPGYKQAYAAVVTAKATSSNVSLYVYDTTFWPGSTSKICKIRGVTAM